MKIIIQVVTALLGVVLIGYSTLQSTHPIAVWSDFKAFEAKVVKSGHCAKLLTYGGESDSESFDDLVAKIWKLKDGWNMIRYVGSLLIVIPIIQMASDRKQIISEQKSRAYR